MQAMFIQAVTTPPQSHGSSTLPVPHPLAAAAQVLLLAAASAENPAESVGG